jgi:PAS domain S-box-containing protein
MPVADTSHVRARARRVGVEVVRVKDAGEHPAVPGGGAGLSDHGRWPGDLVEDLDAIVWEADPQSLQFTFVSGRAEAILGYPVDQWLHVPTFWIDRLAPEDREEAIRVRRAGHDHDLEYRAIAADGGVLWLRDIVRVRRDEAGRPRALRGLTVEVTERKLVEQSLRDSEERFRRLSDATVEGVVVHRKGVIVEVNRAFADMFGYEAASMVGMSVHDLALPESWEILSERLRTGSEEPYDAVGRRRDGSTFVAALVGRR